jgi:hypothetical protein
MRRAPRTLPLAIVAALATASLSFEPAMAQVDGLPDSSFSGDGILSDGSEPYGQWDPRALAVLPNQEVVVVGDLASTVGMDHLRVSVNGNAVTECAAGILLLAEFEGLAVLVDRAGRLVVAGRSTFTGAPDQDRGLIGRFTSANPCAFDSGWSDNGWQILDGESFCDSEDCAVLDLAESPTAGARLYALLSSRVSSLVARLFVVGFRANGDLDTSFGDGGYAEVTAPDLGTLSGVGAQIVVDAAGRPLVLATRWDPDVAVDPDVFLARFTAAGVLDSDFHVDGIQIVDDIAAYDTFPAGLVLLADGSVAVGINRPNRDTCAVFGFRADGTSAGGAGGNFGLSTRIGGLAGQGDGKLLVLLDDLTSDKMETLRLVFGDVIDVDPTYGDGGSWPLDVDLGGGDAQQTVALVLSTGRPWLVGTADGDSGAGMFAMRLRNRYVFADGFEIGTTSFWRR